MYFTREDILKIQKALLQIGTKDSEFKNAQLPLLEQDVIAVVQNGANRKVKVNDIIELFNLLNRQDFINVSDMYDEHYITINEAIKLMPLRKRKEGLVITFQNTSGKWQIYQFKGTIDLFVNPIYWEDLFGLEYPIINSIIPDEEDLTMSKPDEDGNSLLSFKDKDYDPEGFSGMATKILRKHIIEIADPELGKVKKNILYQDDFDKENCIYEIKYDFDLNNQEITIPNNCILRFNGGLISNGTIIGTNTNINASLVKIFDITIILKGSWNVSEAYPEWFGAKGDGITDDSTSIQKTINYWNKIVFNKTKVYGFTQIILKSDLEICGGGTLLYLETNLQQGQAYYPVKTDLHNGNNNIEIHDLTFDGNILNAGKGDNTYSVCDTLTVIGENINIYNCNFVNNVDSGIMYSECKNTQIHHCYINGATDSGIYVNANDVDDGMFLFSIHDNIIKNTGTAAIALKRISGYGTVNNNIISSCGGGVTLEHASTQTDYSKQIDICNNYIRDINAGGLGILIRGGYNHNVIANRIEEFAFRGIQIDCAKQVNCSSNTLVSSVSRVPAILLSSHNSTYTTENININNNIIKTSGEGILCWSNYSNEVYKNINILNNIIECDASNCDILLTNRAYTNVNIIGNIINKLGLPSIGLDQILVKSNSINSLLSIPYYMIDKVISYGNFIRRTYITNELSTVNNVTFSKYDIVKVTNKTGVESYIASADGIGSNVLKVLTSYTA